MRRPAPVDDRLVIAWASPYGPPRHELFDFHRLEPGSSYRAARAAEFDRYLEALRGQGCTVHVWDLEWWNRGYRDWFYRQYQ
jgi:hypothetical protein